MYRILSIVLFLTACCPSQKVAERRISKYVECNPQLSVSDTITVHDTIITESKQIKKDTVISRDTTYLESNGATVKIVLIDTIEKEVPIYLEAFCPPDTVYFESKVATNSVQVTDYKTPFKEKVFNGLVGGLIFLVILAALYFFLRKK